MNKNLVAQYQGMKDQMFSQQGGVGGVVGGAEVPVVRESQEADPASGLVLLGRHRFAADVAERVSELGDRFPSLRVVSGHRDEAANARENGVDRSWHLKGRAVDFQGPVKDLYEAAAHAQRAGADEALVHNAGNGMILHVAWGA